MNPASASSLPATEPRPALRWGIAILVCVAITLSYFDRQTLPWTLSEIQKDYPFSDQVKALFDSAFLLSYGLMYIGGGRCSSAPQSRGFRAA